MNRGSQAPRSFLFAAVTFLLIAAACNRQTGPGRGQPTPGGYFVTVAPRPTSAPIAGQPTHTPVPPR